MSITDHNSNKELIDSIEVKIGKLYFFKNYVVTEFNEGVLITFENFSETGKLIKAFYEDEDFGVITNRTNSYSLNLSDAKKWNTIFPNLKAYAVVSDRIFSKGVFDIENQFFDYNRKMFKTLQEALDWVNEILKSNS